MSRSFISDCSGRRNGAQPTKRGSQISNKKFAVEVPFPLDGIGSVSR
jgi:hypothetical protein